MQACWKISGNMYKPDEKSSQIDLLPTGTYTVQDHPMMGLYLTKTGEDFTFNHKIYGLEVGFVNRVIKSYHSMEDNMGVLLNGVKGTGKSVTAKRICNLLSDKMPVIIIDKAHQGLPQFIANIQQEVIIFIDEFEKVYQEYSSDVLTIMDGVYKTGYKRLFLLTTNNLYINRNMLQRPGRIRYVKTYGDLELSVVNEVIDDLLIYPEFRVDCLEAISTLEIITIDLVKAIINEVNIHNESPTKFMDVFNVKSDLDDDHRKNLDIVEVSPDPSKPALVIKNAHCYTPLSRLDEGWNISTDMENTFIRLVEKYSKDTFKVNLFYNLVKADELVESSESSLNQSDIPYPSVLDEEDDENVSTPNCIKLENGDVLVPTTVNSRQSVVITKIVKITEAATKHYSFNSMVF